MAPSEANTATSEAQNRCSRREADPGSAHGGFQIHQDPFQSTFCRAENPEQECHGGTHHHEFQNQGGSDADSAFYNGPWLDIPFQSIDTSFVFPLTHEIADELERVGGEILGGVNKSKTFRVMVAYFAAVHKLKTPVHSTFA